MKKDKENRKIKIKKIYIKKKKKFDCKSIKKKSNY